jgi:hypothetical protein
MWSKTFAIDDPPFAGRSGRGVRVAVIDSGVASGHPHVGQTEPGIRLYEGGGEDEDAEDRIGHGTAVAAAIREKAPDTAILPIRVFDLHLSTTAEVLARAIRLAAGRRCDLINLSLGTANPARRLMLEEAVRDAIDVGCMVVSPGSQDGIEWLPGCLDGVIRVALDWACPRNAIRIREDEGRVAIHASGYPRPIPGVLPHRNIHGISFATANTTGMFARWLEGHPDVRRAEDVLRSLETEAE